MALALQIKRLILGSPIKTAHAHQERLGKSLALPVFASDALSSVAYATEEVLSILMLTAALGVTYGTVGAPALSAAGVHSIGFLFPICISIALLMVVVSISYVQTIYAYPTGGGSYIVSSQNLGSVLGRIAGGALLIDYTLTVAASISAGVAAMISAANGTPLQSLANHPWAAVTMSLFFLLLITVANLRGLRESGMIFALPAYAFIFGILTLLATAVWKFMIMGAAPFAPHDIPVEKILTTTAEPLTLFLLFRAFSGGCTALTGIEAISDGVPAFRKPESRNAAITLVMMAVIAIVMFTGISWFAHYLNRFFPSHPILTIPQGREGIPYQTVVSQIARATFGGHDWFYYFIQVATTAILVVAANTAFADFPRLSYFIARDSFLPRQLMSQGDRLVFQNGIVSLACVAGVLILWSGAHTHKLLPLYAVGVFISFTLSQAGMVAWQVRHPSPRWPLRAVLSAAGAVVTGVVAVILFITKFHDGAWIVGVLLIILLVVFKLINRHYTATLKELKTTDDGPPLQSTRNTVLLLAPRIHNGILTALHYAKSIGLDCRALHVNIDPEASPVIYREWERHCRGTPLVILESPYRSVVDPILEYVDAELAEHPDSMITVIVPEFVPRRWWQRLLHNNAAVQLKSALGARRNVVVTNVRYFLGR